LASWVVFANLKFLFNPGYQIIGKILGPWIGSHFIYTQITGLVWDKGLTGIHRHPKNQNFGFQGFHRKGTPRQGLASTHISPSLTSWLCQPTGVFSGAFIMRLPY